MKRLNKYIVFITVLFALLVYIEATAPKPVSWEESFSQRDKIPFGGFILHSLLKELFPGSEIRSVPAPLYNALDGNYFDGTNYIFINSTFTPDALDVEHLMLFVERGNRAFIAAHYFPETLTDSLGFEVVEDFSPLKDTTAINFSNPALRESSPYAFGGRFNSAHITKFDTARSTVLGTDKDSNANYIRVPYGAGEFLVSTVPYAFTNYHLLDKRNAEYAFKALSYLPDGRILWDEYYKDGRKEAESPLRYVLSQVPLRWAYYLTLIGVVLFIIFMGRRRQRIIPQIKPLPNTTLEFAETVGQLYYQHGDHRNIAEKKITYFLEHIRTRFGVNTAKRDEEFQRVVAARSGLDIDQVRSVFTYIDATLARTRVQEEELLALNKAIERFHATSKR